MIIWGSLTIPCAALAALYFFCSKKVTWWEYFIPIGSCIALVLIAKAIAVNSLTSDTEYWTGWVTKAEYQEPWTEEWDEYVPPTYDDKGRQTGGGYWQHHVQHHPPHWALLDSNDSCYTISEDTYNHIVYVFGNHTEKEIPHFNQTSWGDGDKWYTTYPGDPDKMLVCTTAHTYENRVQASKSVFNFPEVEDTTNLYDYPEVDNILAVPSILGNCTTKANEQLCRHNATLGRRKQVRIWMLLYENQPIQTAINQENYWKGGNKNELVICVGLRKNKVDWCYVFSWTEVERLKIDVKNFIQQQDTFDATDAIDKIHDLTNRLWKRKEFADFSYIDIEPSGVAIAVTYILTLLVTVCTSAYVVFNEIGQDGRCSSRFRRGFGKERRLLYDSQ